MSVHITHPHPPFLTVGTRHADGTRQGCWVGREVSKIRTGIDDELNTKFWSYTICTSCRMRGGSLVITLAQSTNCLVEWPLRRKLRKVRITALGVTPFCCVFPLDWCTVFLLQSVSQFSASLNSRQLFGWNWYWTLSWGRLTHYISIISLSDIV